jgi:hypothetical protein
MDDYYVLGKDKDKRYKQGHTVLGKYLGTHEFFARDPNGNLKPMGQTYYLFENANICDRKITEDARDATFDMNELKKLGIEEASGGGGRGKIRSRKTRRKRKRILKKKYIKTKSRK